MEKAWSFTASITITIVTVCAIILIALMIKHKTFCDIEWRVKVVMLTYAFCTPTFGLWLVFTKIIDYEGTELLNVYAGAICVWTCIHWQSTVYYLRTACLLKVRFRRK